ncbi:MAG: hypothetical protein LBK52_08005 [Deltaproteobacteria bacterium]|jgi:hypothetical protein|nr:hypothetical protein [Deltaproteobacteria bacterium]
MILRKPLFLCLLAALAGFLLLSGQPLPADDADLDSVTSEQMSKEGPLTQKDYDLYIKYLQTAISGIKAMQKDLPADADPDKILSDLTSKFIADNKLTAVRMRYIIEKVGATELSLESPASLPAPDSDEAFFIPSKDEIQLFEKNKDKLEALKKSLMP